MEVNILEEELANLSKIMQSIKMVYQERKAYSEIKYNFDYSNYLKESKLKELNEINSKNNNGEQIDPTLFENSYKQASAVYDEAYKELKKFCVNSNNQNSETPIDGSHLVQAFKDRVQELSRALTECAEKSPQQKELFENMKSYAETELEKIFVGPPLKEKENLYAFITTLEKKHLDEIKKSCQ